MTTLGTATPSSSSAIRGTTFLEPRFLSEYLNVKLTVVTETFQHTGSFKFRAAYNVALKVPQTQIIAASSGNFGQALAYACKLLSKDCRVVMPSSSAQVKIDAVRAHGAIVELIDTTKTSRAQRIAELVSEFPGAYIASPYDDDLVIQGNSSLGIELAQSGRRWDTILVPVGGGGLISGVVTGLRSLGDRSLVLGAEPALGNDAARSLRAGKIISNDLEPMTMADGARTLSLGKRNWEIIQREVSEILEVNEANIAEAVCLFFRLSNLKVEPTGALTLGAILQYSKRFVNQSICCLVSGGNVDPAVYSRILMNQTFG